MREILKQGYPEPPADVKGRAFRACVALARRLHKAIDDGSSFPSTYDEASRKALMR